jgi:hypothetical protein
VYYQEQNKIELVISDKLTRDEFLQIIHQIESLCSMYGEVDILLDASLVKEYDFTIALDELDFYKRYHDKLRKVAIVSDDQFSKFLLNLFNKFTKTEFKTFSGDQIEQARKWIFPSRLPG